MKANISSTLLAFSVLLAAVMLRTVLDPYLGSKLPFTTLYVAVGIAVWIGRYRLAGAVAIVGYALSHYFFSDDPAFSSAEAIIGMLAYASICAMIIVVGEAMHAARDEAAAWGQLLKFSELERRHSERMLSAVVESSDDAILSNTLDGVIQSWNAGAERIFGYAASQAIGRNTCLIIPPNRHHEEQDMLWRLAVGQRIERFETERIDSKGRPVLVSLTVSPIKDEHGKVIGASRIARDVTRERLVEERQRHLLMEAAAANAKFRAFFDHAAVFACIMEPDGTVLEVNRRSWEELGFGGEPPLGQIFWEGPWWQLSPEIAHTIRGGARQAAAGQPFSAEVRHYAGDRSERVIDMRIAAIKDASGRLLFLATTGIDITERRRLEETLRALTGGQ